MANFITYNSFTGTKVRASEISEYVKGNMTIHVKPPNLDNVKDCEWVDILDSTLLIEMLKERPLVNAIMISQYAFDNFKLPNKTIFIPQQHINWDREKRKGKKLKTCGYIGAPSGRARRYYEMIGNQVKKAGVDFVTCFDYAGREDAVKFYKSIDLLIVGTLHRYEPLKTPTKLINASSFGIPSIAYPLAGYKEWEGNYMPMEIEKLPEQVEKFKNKKYYKEWSDKITKEAEKYHISNIAKLYE